MKNSNSTFKRAIALVICLCMVVSSLVFAPVVSAQTEIANTNTQEYQYYDIDNTAFSDESKTESASFKTDDGTGNYALKLKKRSTGATYVCGVLDYALEAGKEYTVSFYVKGISRFTVCFTNSPVWNEITNEKYVGPNWESSYNYEEYTKVTLGPVTIPDDATYNTIRFVGYAEKETNSDGTENQYYNAECYIDNITIVENANTQELQKYDFDYVNFDQRKTELGYTKDAKDGDNTALKLKVSTAGNSTFYGDLDFDLEQGKKYKVAFDVKGLGYFYVGFSDKYGWGNILQVPNGEMKVYNSPDGYTRYEVEMKTPTDTTRTYTTLMFLSYAVKDEASNYYQAESFIDNITITEECAVTLGAYENGTATLDKTAYYYGETATATASSSKGYLFGGWANSEGEIVSTARTYTFDVTGPVTLVPVFNVNETPNTQELQKYDFDDINFDQSKKEFGYTIDAKDGDNTALKLKVSTTSNSVFYGDLDFDLEQGKKYKVAFDVKGLGYFYVGFSDKYGWGNILQVPDGVMKVYDSPDGYTRYEVEMKAPTDTTRTYTTLVFLSYAVKDEASKYYQAESFIDNITITEEVGITVGTDVNGKTSADGKTIYYGDTVDLTATANPAYRFVKWIDENGAEVSFANPYSFKAETAFNINPVFEAYEATEYVRDFDSEEYAAMAPIVASENDTTVEYVYNETLGKTVAKLTIKRFDRKIAIPFVPKDGKDYRVKIKYLYNGVWFCPFYNGTYQNDEGAIYGSAGNWVEQDWYFTQEGNELFYLWTYNLKEGSECVIYIDSISFIESTKGDLNNDDAINSTDITLLMKYLLGINNDDIDLSAANVSQINDVDKLIIDVRDLVDLKKKIATIK